MRLNFDNTGSILYRQLKYAKLEGNVGNSEVSDTPLFK